MGWTHVPVVVYFIIKENKTVTCKVCWLFLKSDLRTILVPFLATTFKLLSLLSYYFKQYYEWRESATFEPTCEETGGELTCQCAVHTNKTKSLHSQTSGYFRARPIRPLWAGPLLQRSQLLWCMWVDSALIKCTDLPDSFQRHCLWSASPAIKLWVQHHFLSHWRTVCDWEMRSEFKYRGNKRT